MKYVYLTPDGARHLHSYRYRGQDLSITYRYVLSPLAEAICQTLPDYISANLVKAM